MQAVEKPFGPIGAAKKAEALPGCGAHSGPEPRLQDLGAKEITDFPTGLPPAEHAQRPKLPVPRKPVPRNIRAGYRQNPLNGFLTAYETQAS
jgi:hypothetical protein